MQPEVFSSGRVQNRERKEKTEHGPQTKPGLERKGAGKRGEEGGGERREEKRGRTSRQRG